MTRMALQVRTTLTVASNGNCRTARSASVALTPSVRPRGSVLSSFESPIITVPSSVWRSVTTGWLRNGRSRSVTTIWPRSGFIGASSPTIVAGRQRDTARTHVTLRRGQAELVAVLGDVLDPVAWPVGDATRIEGGMQRAKEAQRIHMPVEWTVARPHHLAADVG